MAGSVAFGAGGGMGGSGAGFFGGFCELTILKLKHEIMKKYKLAVFDMDGTLFDSIDTIYNAAIDTFEKLGMKNVEFPRDKFSAKIGGHFADIFEEFGIEVPDVEHYIDVYKDIYFNHIDDTKFYPGIPELLTDLKNSGAQLALLTTKNQFQTERIADKFGLHEWFGYLMGRKQGVKIKPDPEPLEIIIDHFATAKADTVMIGDSEFDIGCGHNAGVDTIAAGYGYRNREFLLRLKPTFFAADVSELRRLLLG
ncbi:MAG: Phosphoglycolate phosphatase [Ignavibacteriaceae bacterium]|nr:Phosphoglycolate phosphatase [Ignavibacteriaceae bacterium]